MAITKEQIFSAAADIVAAGGGVTLAAVRKAVGGGSYTTISEALKEWRAASVPVPVVLREPAPQVLADRLADVINETWSMALEMANDRLKTEREALAQVRVDLEAARLEAADLADQLSADLEAAQGVIAAHVAAAAAAVVEADRQAGELARLAADLVQAGNEARTASASLVAAVERAGEAEKLAGVLAERLAGAERREAAAAVAAAAKLEAAERREAAAAVAAAAKLEAAERREAAASAAAAAAAVAAAKVEAMLQKQIAGLVADLAAVKAGVGAGAVEAEKPVTAPKSKAKPGR